MVVSIMLLALVMGISLAISSLTIREFKTQSETQASVAAYFGADTGMEQALYEHFHGSPVLPATYSGTLGNGIDYFATLQSVQNLEGHLHVDETRQFSLLNNNIQEITLEFDLPTEPAYDTPVVPGNSSPSMTYKLVSFPTANFEEREVVVKEGMCDLACGQAGWVIPVDFPIDKNHILRIKPVKNGVSYRISVSTGLGSFELLTVESRGEAKNGTIKRALYTELSDEIPVMGLWDYVLFSGSDFD